MQELSSLEQVAVLEHSRLEKVATFLTMLLMSVLPVFYISLWKIPGEFQKTLVAALLVIIPLVIWALSRLIDGKFIFSKDLIIYGACAVLCSTILSTIFSAMPSVSYGGLGFELTTFISVAIFLGALFVASLYIRSFQKITYVFTSFFIGAAVIYLLQLINLFIRVPILGLESTSSTLIGRWAELGVFAGLVLIASITILSRVQLTKVVKIFLWFLVLFSLVFLVLVNQSTAWVVLAVVLALLLLNSFSNQAVSSNSALEGTQNFSYLKTRRASLWQWFSVGVILLSLIFVFFAKEGSKIDGYIQNITPRPLEVRPSWSGTSAVIKEVLKTDPILGIGPGRFDVAWQNWKPAAVNESLFWGVDFAVGIGLIPTMFATNGILGVVAWIFLLIAVLLGVLQMLFVRSEDAGLRGGALAVGLGTLYLWVIGFVYVPGVVMTVMMMFWAGLIVGLRYKLQPNRAKQFSVSQSTAFGFVSVLAMIVGLIALITLSYSFVARARAWLMSVEAAQAISAGDLKTGVQIMDKVVSIYPSDAYLRVAAEYGMAELDTVLAEQNADKDALQNRFLEVYSRTQGYASKATNEINPYNYQNWLILARVYEKVLPLGIEVLYDSAVASYDQAARYAPKNPLIPYSRAKLEFSRNNISLGREYLQKAIDLKSNYTQALLDRAQLAVQEGNLDKAIQDGRQAVTGNPNDLGALFQLGVLEYMAKSYLSAVAPLERAVSLNPNYSNARYFLGLSYDELDRKEDAVKQFEYILQLNPGESLVENILANLRAGRPALSGIPKTELPASDEPPIKDEINN